MKEHLEMMIRYYTDLRDFHLARNQEESYHRESVEFYQRAIEGQQKLLAAL